jgi:hypothetical protein
VVSEMIVWTLNQPESVNRDELATMLIL